MGCPCTESGVPRRRMVFDVPTLAEGQETFLIALVGLDFERNEFRSTFMRPPYAART